MDPIRGASAYTSQPSSAHPAEAVQTAAEAHPSGHARSLTMAMLSHHAQDALNAKEMRGSEQEKELVKFVKDAIRRDQLRISPNQPPNGIAQFGMRRNQEVLVVQAKLNERSEYDVLSIGFKGSYGDPLSLKLAVPTSILKSSSVKKSTHYQLHTMWYRRSRAEPSIDGNAFHTSLFEAYTSMHQALDNASTLVSSGHLWTEHQSDADILAPLVKKRANQRLPLHVHTIKELGVFIEAQQPSVARLIKRLQELPATENIGLRSDIERMVYGIVYKIEDSAAEHQVNIHLDVDALKDLGCSGGHADVVGNAGNSVPNEKIGFASRTDRNDMLFIRPGDPDAIRVAEKMLNVLEKGTFLLDAGSSPEIAQMAKSWTTGTRFLTSLLKSLATSDPAALGRDVTSTEMMKRFTMADVLCKQRDTVQAHVNTLISVLNDKSSSQSEKNDAKIIIAGISEVYRSCAQMIESYVNLCVFLPQIEHAHQGGSEMVDEICKSIFGKSLPAAGANTWRATTLNIPDELQMHDLSPQDLENAMRTGFAKLRPLVPEKLL